MAATSLSYFALVIWIRAVLAQDHNNHPCARCELQANKAFDYFTNFHFFKVNENNNITNPWKLAGEQSCNEFLWAYQCFQHCKDELEQGVSYYFPPRYEHLQTVLYKFCEPKWEGQDKQCRMADTRVCDMKYNKRSCGEEFTSWKQCISEVLAESELDCSGVCTPARRYHKALLYQWELDCRLRNAVDGRCGDYINLFCFGYMKDTDLSWGYFENMNTHEDYRNLTYFCEYLEEPPVCMQETVDTWLTYFGFNLTRPCGSVSSDITWLKKEWSNIVRPFCQDRPYGTETIQEVCGSKPTTVRIPTTSTTSTTTTTATTTTTSTAPTTTATPLYDLLFTTTTDVSSTTPTLQPDTNAGILSWLLEMLQLMVQFTRTVISTSTEIQSTTAIPDTTPDARGCIDCDEPEYYYEYDDDTVFIN